MAEYKDTKEIETETAAKPEPVRLLNSVMALHIFYSETCNPCYAAKPELIRMERELKEKYPNNFITAWHSLSDPDSQFDVYNITNVPTIILKQIATDKNEEVTVNCIYRWMGMPSDTKAMQEFLEAMIQARELLPKIDLFES